MNLGFSDLISKIDSKISPEYVGGAITWADEKYNGAWSNAINRFDLALSKAIETNNYAYAKIEGDVYLNAILPMLSEFKGTRKLSAANAFLVNLKSRASLKELPKVTA